MTNADSISWREGYSEGYAEGHWAGRSEAIKEVLRIIDELKNELASQSSLPIGYFISHLKDKVEELLGGSYDSD